MTAWTGECVDMAVAHGIGGESRPTSREAQVMQPDLHFLRTDYAQRTRHAVTKILRLAPGPAARGEALAQFTKVANRPASSGAALAR